MQQNDDTGSSRSDVPALPPPSAFGSVGVSTVWQSNGECLLGLTGQIPYECDPASGQVRWGSTLEQVLGYAVETATGGLPQWFEWIHPQDRDEVRQRLRAAERTFAALDADYRIRHARGDYVWVRDRGYFVTVGEGRTRIVRVGLLQETSAQKRAADALRLDEQRLDALLRLSQMDTTSLQGISDFALEEAVRLTSSSIGYLAFMNEDETVLTMHSWSHTAMAECAVKGTPRQYPVASTGLWGEAVRQRQPVITNDYQAPSPQKRGLPPGHVPIRCHLNIPVFDGERIVAVAGVGNKGSDYDAADVRQLTLLMQGMWRLLQRHRADAALRDSEARFRSIVTAAPLGLHFYRLEDDGRLVFEGANPAADSILHIANAALVGCTIEEAFPGLVGTAIPDHYRDLARAGGTWRVEPLDYDQGQLHGTFEVTAFQTSPGRVAAAFRDVTERRHMERALRESEMRYRGVVENTLVGICISKDEAILYANQTLIRMAGCDHLGEFAAKPISAYLVPASAAHANAYFLARARGEAVPPEFDIEAVRKDGTVRTLRLCTSAVCFDGRTCELSTFLDVTEQRRAEQERLDMQRRLLHTQKLESLGVLAGGIAHDFNNLLMAVLGNLDMAISDVPLGSPARLSIQHAMQASRRATDLTREMLAYSGRGHFMLKRLDLNQLVRENADLLRTAMLRTVVLELRLSPERTIVAADPGQIQQVVMNLITNASEAIGARPGTVVLTTGYQECREDDLARTRLEEKPAPGRFAFIDVRDNGCGMDEATQQRLFDPFFTTKTTGRGLGMSAVLGIVRGHHGAILVDSQVARGTTIRVLFPAAAPAAADEAAAGKGAAGPAALGALTGLLLVVDDDADIRRLCLAYARRLGLTALPAADGCEAVALFRQHAERVDCVLLDLTMPNLDGVETYRELKRLRPDVQVILCSGYTQQDAAQRFSGQGLAGFLQKPYELQQLRTLLEGIMRKAT